MSSGRKVVVVGSGAREHALAVALATSPSVAQVVVTPGNAGTVGPIPGTDQVLRSVPGEAEQVARDERADLVVVGPEAPLVGGLADRLRSAGIPVFGPSAAAARLEGSKAHMKAFAERHGLRTARHVTVRTLAEAERAIRDFPVAPVVKADGLCAGKGVVVATTHEEALDAARGMLSGAAFGAAGTTVVIEERLLGEEVSVHAVSDGERVLVLPAAQDHKRIGEGDTGPNTGGMGAYAPAPVVTPALGERIAREFMQRAVDGARADGAPFVGALFAGLMIAPPRGSAGASGGAELAPGAGEPVLLEFNVRFGDPETEVLLALLEGDVAELLASAAAGRLAPEAVRVGAGAALTVVMAAAGYPGTPRTGDAITGLDAAGALPGVRVFHAGTRREGERVVTAGGRVLAVTARGATLVEARDRAYAAVERVRFDGAQARRDIGHRALGR